MKIGETMKDSEFIELKNRFLVGIGISLLIGIPIFIFYLIRLDFIAPNIVKKIENQDSFFLLVEEKNCKKCREVKQKLSQLKVDYKVVSTEESNLYNKILDKLGEQEKNFPPPTIIYIEEGSLLASLPDVQSENDLLEFISNYIE